jgi:DNA-binding response OmpR family regulator
MAPLPGRNEDSRLTEKRILVVEDEATTRLILAYALRREGYVVDTVVGAAAAAKRLEAPLPYELVLTDWLLPDGSGTEIADAAVMLGTKALIISGALHRLPDGADERHELLPKSLGPAEIVAAVRQAIGSPTENASAPASPL